MDTKKEKEVWKSCLMTNIRITDTINQKRKVTTTTQWVYFNIIEENSQFGSIFPQMLKGPIEYVVVQPQA